MSVVKSIIENPFVGRTDGVVFGGQSFVEEDKNDIVDFYEKEKIVKIGEGEDDYRKDIVVVEYDRKNRRDYINSFRNDVGILNILRKCALAGEDPVDGRYAAEAKYNDISEMPETFEEAIDAVIKGQEAFKSLDPDLKANASSIEEFVKLYGDEQVFAYVQRKTAEEVAKSQEKDKGE